MTPIACSACPLAMSASARHSEPAGRSGNSRPRRSASARASACFSCSSRHATRPMRGRGSRGARPAASRKDCSASATLICFMRRSPSAVNAIGRSGVCTLVASTSRRSASSSSPLCIRRPARLTADFTCPGADSSTVRYEAAASSSRPSMPWATPMWKRASWNFGSSSTARSQQVRAVSMSCFAARQSPSCAHASGQPSRWAMASRAAAIAGSTAPAARKVSTTASRACSTPRLPSEAFRKAAMAPSPLPACRRADPRLNHACPKPGSSSTAFSNAAVAASRRPVPSIETPSWYR